MDRPKKMHLRRKRNSDKHCGPTTPTHSAACWTQIGRLSVELATSMTVSGRATASALVLALLSVSLAAPGQLTVQSHQDSGSAMSQTESAVPGLHDFDFLVGQWKAHHRKLKQRLANNHEWIEFEGTLLNRPLMGSYSNVDDTVLSVPGAPY